MPNERCGRRPCWRPKYEISGFIHNSVRIHRCLARRGDLRFCKFPRRARKTLMANYVCRMFLMEESDMDYRACSDTELLKILLGEKTAETPLTSAIVRLFLEEPQYVELHPMIAAPAELVPRALVEGAPLGRAAQAPA